MRNKNESGGPRHNVGCALLPSQDVYQQVSGEMRHSPVFQACFTSNKVSRAALSDGNVTQATHVSLGFLTATFKKSTRKEVTLI